MMVTQHEQGRVASRHNLPSQEYMMEKKKKVKNALGYIIAKA